MGPLTITSLQNPRVKSAVQLRRRRGREQQDLVLIDGAREIGRALSAGVEIVELFACPEACDEPARQLVAACSQRSVAVLTVTPAVFTKLAYGDRAEGVMAVARVHHRTLAEMELGKNPLLAVLEAVEKPGNVGAVLRTADAAGVSGLIVAEGGTDVYNPNAIRASLGAVFTVPVCQADKRETVAWLRQQRLRIFAARVDGAVDYAAVSFCQPCAIVLGSEAHGLSNIWQGADVTAIRLPMRGAVDSLNVSTTAAVLFYEALRQRRAAGM